MTHGGGAGVAQTMSHSKSAPALASSASRTTFAPGTKGPPPAAMPPSSSSSSSNIITTTHPPPTKAPPPSFTFTSAPEGYNQAPTFPQMDRGSTSSNGLFLGSTLTLTAAGPGSYKGIDALYPLLAKSPSKTRLQTTNRRHRDLRPLVGSMAALSLNGADRLLYEDGPDMNNYDLSHMNSFNAAISNKGFGTSVFKSEQGRFPPSRTEGAGVVLGVGLHEARKYHFRVPSAGGGGGGSPRREDKLDKERKTRREERKKLLDLAERLAHEKRDRNFAKEREREAAATMTTTAAAGSPTSRDGATSPGGRPVTPAFDGILDWAEVDTRASARQLTMDPKTAMPPPAQFKMFSSWKDDMPDIAFLEEEGLQVRPWTDRHRHAHARSATKSSQKSTTGGGGQVTVKFDNFPKEDRREETVVFGNHDPPKFASLRTGGIEAYLEVLREAKAGSKEVQSLDGFKAPNTKSMRFY